MIFAMLVICIIFMIIVTVVLLKKTPSPSWQRTENNGENSQNGAQTEPKSSFLDTIAPFLRMIGFTGITGGTDATTAQEFLPFDKVEDSMICISDKYEKKFYRMIVECGSINYSLKTTTEQDTVDSQFMTAITGWNFPWAIYVQTRALDNRAFIVQAKNDITNVSMKYPTLAEYGQAYYKFLQDTVSPSSSRALIKKKYIIIACNEASAMTDRDDAEKQEWAFEQLYNRASNVMASLRKMGINSHICNNSEISGIIFQAFSKKTGGAIDGVTSADFMAGTVAGRSEDEKITDLDMSRMIQEFVNEIDVAIQKSTHASDEDRTKAFDIRSKIVQLGKEEQNNGQTRH